MHALLQVSPGGWPFSGFHAASRVANGTMPTRYELANVPSPVLSSGLGCPQAGVRGVVFSKLSKLLNQENALSAPCLPHFDFCSPQAPGRGAEMLRTGVIRRFRCHISICYTRVTTPTSAMPSRWLAADARVERAGARPSRAVVIRRPWCVDT
jgi:hypothetical protein